MSYLIPRRRARVKKRRQITLYLLMALVLMLLLPAIFAPVLAPNDPSAGDIMQQQQGPSARFPFGTDHLGRCVLSRILYGAMTSVFSSLGIIAVVFVVGSVLGILSGYFGGLVDTIIMRITTILQAFPWLLLAIALAGVLGVGIGNTILALCVIYWTEYARIARSLTLSIKERTYIKAARVCGENHVQIILRHIIPNVFPSLIVTATLDIGAMIMEVAALSYLGLGVKPSMPEWGSMMNLGKQYLQSNPWLVLIPGIAIFITVVIFNLFGEKLRDLFDLT